jgi:hypothetical protein
VISLRRDVQPIANQPTLGVHQESFFHKKNECEVEKIQQGNINDKNRAILSILILQLFIPLITTN